MPYTQLFSIVAGVLSVPRLLKVDRLLQAEETLIIESYLNIFLLIQNHIDMECNSKDIYLINDKMCSRRLLKSYTKIKKGKKGFVGTVRGKRG